MIKEFFKKNFIKLIFILEDKLDCILSRKKYLYVENILEYLKHKLLENLSIDSRKNLDLFLDLIYYDPSIIKYIDESILYDYESLRKLIITNILIYSYFPEKIINDKNIILEIVKCDHKIYHLIPSNLLKDEYFITNLLKVNVLVSLFLSDEHKENRQNIEILVKNNYLDTNRNSKWLKDIDFIKEMIELGYPNILLYAPLEYIEDHDLILLAVKRGLNIDKLPIQTLISKNIALEYIELNPGKISKKIINYWIRDKEVALKCLNSNLDYSEYLTSEIRNDKDIVEIMIELSVKKCQKLYFRYNILDKNMNNFIDFNSMN